MVVARPIESQERVLWLNQRRSEEPSNWSRLETRRLVRSPVSQAKHKNKWNQHNAALETDSNVHLPTESDQGPALPKADQWPLGQTKEAMPQAVVVLRSQIVVLMKNTQIRLW
jgi:hypothetical protein